MPLTSDTRLGPYAIIAPLGAGGMGEVYRARDTRLDRIVAIKVLPAQAADNPEARQRFEREARAVSALNHPHICTLYDVGRQDGIDFLVMEYLEGESLSQRLAAGLLPVAEALRYAVHVAEALAEAHRHGVLHRDLKPGNIMLTKAGAKLLDFGLAKLREDPAAALGVSLMPTRTKDLTQKGSILGTVRYMAPEQLEGKDADARSDIFAFGAVLYEMLAGRQAFVGESLASVITAIMTSQPPPVSTLVAGAPALDHLIQKCLAKDPEERWQTAHDLAGELKWIAEDRSPPGPASVVATAPTPGPVPAAMRPWIGDGRRRRGGSLGSSRSSDGRLVSSEAGGTWRGSLPTGFPGGYYTGRGARTRTRTGRPSTGAFTRWPEAGLCRGGQGCKTLSLDSFPRFLFRPAAQRHGGRRVPVLVARWAVCRLLRRQ